MGKWTNLKDSIPREEKDPNYSAKVRAEQARLSVVTEDEVTRPATMIDFVQEYNRLDAEKKAAAEREKEINLTLEALTGLINDANKQSGSDIWRGLGYSFSEKVEPYASVADKGAVLEHFLPLRKLRKDFEVMLGSPTLKRSDLAGLVDRLLDVERRAGILSVPYQTLNGMVKTEAEAGDLTIETVKGENGEPDKTIVKSTIPGVNVFLKSGLNRRKA